MKKRGITIDSCKTHAILWLSVISYSNNSWILCSEKCRSPLILWINCGFLAYVLVVVCPIVPFYLFIHLLKARNLKTNYYYNRGKTFQLFLIICFFFAILSFSRFVCPLYQLNQRQLLTSSFYDAISHWLIWYNSHFKYNHISYIFGKMIYIMTNMITILNYN